MSDPSNSSQFLPTPSGKPSNCVLPWLLAQDGRWHWSDWAALPILENTWAFCFFPQRKVNWNVACYINNFSVITAKQKDRVLRGTDSFIRLRNDMFVPFLYRLSTKWSALWSWWRWTRTGWHQSRGWIGSLARWIRTTTTKSRWTSSRKRRRATHLSYCYCSVTCRSEGMHASMLRTEYVLFMFSQFHKINTKYIWTTQMNLLLVVEKLVCMECQMLRVKNIHLISNLQQRKVCKISQNCFHSSIYC